MLLVILYWLHVLVMIFWIYCVKYITIFKNYKLTVFFPQLLFVILLFPSFISVAVICHIPLKICDYFLWLSFFFVFSSLVMMCSGVVLLVLILLGVHRDFWNWVNISPILENLLLWHSLFLSFGTPVTHVKLSTVSHVFFILFSVLSVVFFLSVLTVLYWILTH